MCIYHISSIKLEKNLQKLHFDQSYYTTTHISTNCRSKRLKVKGQKRKQKGNMGTLVWVPYLYQGLIFHMILSIPVIMKNRFFGLNSSCNSFLRGKKKKNHKGKKHMLHHKLPLLSTGRHSYLRLAHVRVINISFQTKNLTIKIYL